MTARPLSFNPARLIRSADRETITNIDGQLLIDLATGGLGFGVPDIVDTVRQQTTVMGLSNRVMMSEPLLRLCRRLADSLPAPLATTYVCSSGDEAFEGALKLCKGLRPERKRLAYIAGSEFGTLTFGRCLGAPGEYPQVASFLDLQLLPVHLGAGDPLPGVRALSDCYALCYSPLVRSASGSLELIDAAQLSTLAQLARQAKVPLICQATDICLGQSGTPFGFEHYDVVPDVLVLGGALAGHTVPVGCYVSTEAMAFEVYGRSSPAKHGSTTGGNPLSCTAALAALDYAEKIDASSRFQQLGRQIADALPAYTLGVTGGVVNLRVPPRLSDPALLAERLLSAGVLVRVPYRDVLTLYPNASSRTDVLAGALDTIRSVFDGQHSH